MSIGDVHVWIRRTAGMDERAVQEVVGLLSADERARYERFHFARDRRDYAAAHALLRTALSEYAKRPAASAPADWRFDTIAGGKPVLAPETPAPLAFNLSHTRGCVAVAVTAGAPVGIDVEALDREPDVDGVADRFFGPDEVAWLRRADGRGRKERFFRLWTLKEAYLKATGEGIAKSLHAIGFDVAPDGSVASFHAPPGMDASRWTFATEHAAPGYLLSVAVEGISELRLVISRM